MSNQYGHSNKSKNNSPKSINKGPKQKDQDHFSIMKKVDEKEMHSKSMESFAANADHVKDIPLSDHHAYKRQSHAARPSGPIDSVPGIKQSLSKELKIKRPDMDGDYTEGDSDLDD